MELKTIQSSGELSVNLMNNSKAKNMSLSQGREILQSTVDLVQNNLNLEVISYD